MTLFVEQAVYVVFAPFSSKLMQTNDAYSATAGIGKVKSAPSGRHISAAPAILLSRDGHRTATGITALIYINNIHRLIR